MTLTVKEKIALRGQAKGLPEILRIGKNGVSAGVLAQLEEEFSRRSLLKIRIDQKDRAAREDAIRHLCEHLRCECVGVVGRTAALFRPPERTLTSGLES